MKRLVSMRTRLTTVILLILLSVFVVIAVFFNLTMEQYIDSEIVTQLGQAVDWVERAFPEQGVGQPPPFIQGDASFPEMVEGANIIARRVSELSNVQAFVVNTEYVVQVPQGGLNDSILGETQEIVEMALEKNIQMNDRQQHNLRVNGKDYVLTGTTVHMRRLAGNYAVSESQMTVVFYIDNSGLNMLLQQVNFFLLLIIVLTGAAAFIIVAIVTKRMTRPIRALSEFAVSIGNGDFRRREIHTRDRELTELGNRMNQTVEQLEKYDSEQKVFFQNVSHELRTPLMSIRGYTEGIKYDMFEDINEPTDVILAETERLTEMMEDLIYISKIDNIKTDVVYAESDLREVLSRCANNLKGVILNSGVEVSYHFPEQPVLLICDERQCEKAFGNILSNGLRYAKAQLVMTCLEESDWVTVAVQDDGEGIDPDSLPHVFERFFKGKNGKHGIGLAIAKSVFENHGGTITAQNNEIGALFIVRLPKTQGRK